MPRTEILQIKKKTQQTNRTRNIAELVKENERKLLKKRDKKETEFIFVYEDLLF